jgi:translation initiation factor 2 subunit 1
MEFKKIEWPEPGDLVLTSVQRIVDYGAYVTLDEYGKEGLLHVSEISSGWVRNIRDFVREGQKVILKVLRVNIEKGQVDLSLRRVSKRERREKALLWKRERKAEGLLRSISEKLNVSNELLYAKIGTLIEEKFGSLYEGLEKIAIEGPDLLIEAGLSKDMATTIAIISKEKIRVPKVRIKGMIELQCIKPNGVVHIREALINAQKIEKPEGTEVHVYVIATPKYALEVLAKDYKEAETLLQKVSETAIRTITKAEGTGIFQRGK